MTHGGYGVAVAHGLVEPLVWVQLPVATHELLFFVRIFFKMGNLFFNST